MYFSTKDPLNDNEWKDLEEVQTIYLDPKHPNVPITLDRPEANKEKYHGNLSVLTLLLDQKRLAGSPNAPEGLIATSLDLKNPNDRVRQFSTEGTHEISTYKNRAGQIQVKFAYRLYSITLLLNYNGWVQGRDDLKVEFVQDANNTNPRLVFRISKKIAGADGASAEPADVIEVLEPQIIPLTRVGDDFWPAAMGVPSDRIKDDPNNRKKEGYRIVDILKEQQNRSDEGFFATTLRVEPKRAHQSGAKPASGGTVDREAYPPIASGEVLQAALNREARTIYFRGVTYGFATFEQTAGVVIEDAKVVGTDTGPRMELTVAPLATDEASSDEAFPPEAQTVLLNLDTESFGPAANPGSGARTLSLLRVLSAQQLLAAGDPESGWFSTELSLASGSSRSAAATGAPRGRSSGAASATGEFKVNQSGLFKFRGTFYYMNRLANKWGVGAEEIAARYDLTDPSDARLIFSAEGKADQIIHLVQAVSGGKTTFYPAVYVSPGAALSGSVNALNVLRDQKSSPDERFFKTDLSFEKVKTPAAPRVRKPRDAAAAPRVRTPRIPRAKPVKPVKTRAAAPAERPKNHKETIQARLDGYFAEAPAEQLGPDELWVYVDASERFGEIRHALEESAKKFDLPEKFNRRGHIVGVKQGPSPGVFKVTVNAEADSGFANTNHWAANVTGVSQWNPDRHWAKTKAAGMKPEAWIANSTFPYLVKDLSHIAFYDADSDPLGTREADLLETADETASSSTDSDPSLAVAFTTHLGARMAYPADLKWTEDPNFIQLFKGHSMHADLLMGIPMDFDVESSNNESNSPVSRIISFWLEKNFRGKRVLVLGPEDNTFSRRHSLDNLVEAFRRVGVEADGVSPYASEDLIQKGGYFAVSAHQMTGVDDNSYDVVVSIGGLYDPLYLDTIFRNNTTQQREFLEGSAAEISRVLRPNGKAYIQISHSHGNPDMYSVLESSKKYFVLDYGVMYGGRHGRSGEPQQTVWELINYKPKPAAALPGARLSAAAPATQNVDMKSLTQTPGVLGSIEPITQSDVERFAAAVTAQWPVASAATKIAPAQIAVEIDAEKFAWLKLWRDASGQLMAEIAGTFWELKKDGGQVRREPVVSEARPVSGKVRLSPEEWTQLQQALIQSYAKPLDRSVLPGANAEGVVFIHLDGLIGNDALSDARLSALVQAVSDYDFKTALVLKGSDGNTARFRERLDLQDRKSRALPRNYASEDTVNGVERAVHVMSRTDRANYTAGVTADADSIRTILFEDITASTGENVAVHLYKPGITAAQALSRLTDISPDDDGLRMIYDYVVPYLGSGARSLGLSKFSEFLAGQLSSNDLDSFTFHIIATLNISQAIQLYALGARLSRQSA
jgi:hypothetical protein